MFEYFRTQRKKERKDKVVLGGRRRGGRGVGGTREGGGWHVLEVGGGWEASPMMHNICSAEQLLEEKHHFPFG